MFSQLLYLLLSTVVDNEDDDDVDDDGADLCLKVKDGCFKAMLSVNES